MPPRLWKAYRKSPGNKHRKERDREVDQVQDVFEHRRVIHRAALEVASVGEDLLGELLFEECEAGVEPLVVL